MLGDPWKHEPMLDAEATPKHSAEGVQDSDAAEKKRCRVLIIDDRREYARLTLGLLEHLGCIAVVAWDGPQGVEQAKQFLPDVVLCDLSLCGSMDGYAVAEALAREPSLQRTRLIAVTGYDEPEYRQRAVQAGFSDYLVKPVELEKLQRVVECADLQTVDSTIPWHG